MNAPAEDERRGEGREGRGGGERNGREGKGGEGREGREGPREGVSERAETVTHQGRES